MTKTTVCRPVIMPDLLRVARYERAPEFGPRVLFFSGGSALRQTSRVLKKFTHNSIHLVTPFDSGGSSAILRKAFDMPAIGDMRARMMALADETISGSPEIFQLFSYRLPKDAKQKDLYAQLLRMAEGKDERILAVKNPMRRLITKHLSMFLDHMPEGFDLKGASIGNLILSAGYLNHNHKLDPVIFMFSKLVNVLGQVATVVDDKYHLAVKLDNGEVVVGQHLITGKEVKALERTIKEIYLVEDLDRPQKVSASLPKKKKKLIQQADLICYAPGSFYTSLVANLLPKGVGQTIAGQYCPKIYVPSLGDDPEQIGMDVDQSIFKLLEYLQKDGPKTIAPTDVLTHVLIDSENANALKPSSKAKLKKMGVSVIETRLVSVKSAPYYDPQLLVTALLSLT